MTSRRGNTNLNREPFEGRVTHWRRDWDPQGKLRLIKWKKTGDARQRRAPSVHAAHVQQHACTNTSGSSSTSSTSTPGGVGGSRVGACRTG
jgi:hypothetical protein